MQNDILKNAVQPGASMAIPEDQMPPEAEKDALKENDMSKIGEQEENQFETPSIVDEAMGIVDSAMAELQSSPDPKAAIKVLAQELQALVGDENY